MHMNLKKEEEEKVKSKSLAEFTEAIDLVKHARWHL